MPLLFAGAVLIPALILLSEPPLKEHTGAKAIRTVSGKKEESSPDSPAGKLVRNHTRNKRDGQKPGDAELNSPVTQEVEKVEVGRVQAGDTVGSILSEYLGASEIAALSRECREVYPLRRIKAGHEYRLMLRESGLSGFEYDIDSHKKLRVSMEQGSFRVSKEEISYITRKKRIRGQIESNLFQAVGEAGGSTSLAVSLAEIFAWDVDFIRDLRPGDSFTIVATERYRRGEFVGYGNIRAARFINQGEAFDAFLYQTSSGRKTYFNSEGVALKKTFLKAPLNFTRISSGYTWKRKHPVLDTVRPHLGIDYAAPRGTPIKSVADGRVLGRDYTRQAGNYVKIRHPNGYVTIYNHMSRFGQGISSGKEVEQGEVIGYVGSTGLSTGPHLDYRVKRYGKYMNPRAIDSQPVKSVPESEMAEFHKSIQPLQSALKEEGTKLASRQDGEGS